MAGVASPEELAAVPRTKPNILITGTPGVGKSTTATMLGEALGMTVINVGDWVKTKGFHAESKDAEYDAYVLDEDAEDRLMDAMEPEMAKGGIIVDFHSCEFFPERWFDLVLVLRANNTVLYDRLAKRGYSQLKLKENVEAEIMQVVLEEARQSYPKEIVHELKSDTVEDMEGNIERALQWAKSWTPQGKK